MEDLKNQEMEQENSTDEDTKNSNNDNIQNQEQEAKVEKSYSEDEVNEIVQRRLARERKKFNKLLDSDEFDKELIEREKKVTLRELRADAKEALSELDMPIDFIDLIDFTNKESMDRSIKVIEKIKNEYISPMIDNEVKKRFKGRTPKNSNVTNISSLDPVKKAFEL